MKKTHDAIATIGNYIDATTGKKVKRTLPIGAVFESPQGRIVLKLDAVPVSKDWSGWVALRPCSTAHPEESEGDETEAVPSSPPHCLVLPPELAAVVRDSGFAFAVGLFSDDPPDQPARLYLYECTREAAITAANIASGRNSADQTLP